jgi:hypothetical protein
MNPKMTARIRPGDITLLFKKKKQKKKHETLYKYLFLKRASRSLLRFRGKENTHQVIVHRK